MSMNAPSEPFAPFISNNIEAGTTKTALDLRAIIVNTLVDEGECWLETLLAICSDFTWNQVILEIDRMSRIGQIVLTCHGFGEYRVSLPPQYLPGTSNVA
jgi:hypothetical protein